MKRLFFILLLFLTVGLFAQQDSSKWTLGVDISTLFSGYGSQILISPNINVSYRNYVIGGGPTFIALHRYPSSITADADFIGIYGYYRIYIMPKTGNMELFPEYNFIYSRYKGNSDWSSRDFEHYIGLGAKIRFSNRMYTNYSSGIGAVFSSRINWPYYDDVPERTQTKKFTGILKVGIGYGF